MNSGVYVITSLSGGQYVGSAMQFSRRWSEHKRRLRVGNHHSRALQSAWNKYGEDGLVFSPILSCEPKDLLFYEQRAMDILHPKYNICKVAGSAAGVVRTAETRAKVAAANKGRPMPEITRLRLLAANTGRKLDEAHKQRISAFNKGRKHSAEMRRKISESKRGRKNSEESKERSLLTRLGGRPYSEAHRVYVSSVWTKKQAEAANAKACKCLDTGDVFQSQKIAAEWLKALGHAKASFKSINAAVQGRKETAYGFRWGEA